MSNELDFSLRGGGPVADAVIRRGFASFSVLAEHVRRLPYGRPEGKDDALAPLRAQMGTCSSKHRLLVAVAHDCGHADIQLMVGMYRMSGRNTPGVGAALAAAGVRWIPEAHCYLEYRGERHDYTGLSSGSTSPFDALFSEEIVSPANLPHDKERLHRTALATWARQNGLSFADAWALRETCIAALVSNGGSLLSRPNGGAAGSDDSATNRGGVA